MPVLCTTALKLLLILLASGHARLDGPLAVPGSDDLLQYDDGTANWLVWSGLYRGTWFNTADFGLGFSWLSSSSQLWFYHHASYPWDVSAFYCDLCNGLQTGPVTILDQTSVTAVHYQPVYAGYSPPISCEGNFWILVDTEMSAGGWPSVLGDNTPQTADHSFFSDDFIVWEPWIISGPTANDFFIRSGYTGLEEGSWASIKAQFR